MIIIIRHIIRHMVHNSSNIIIGTLKKD
jgi:hypothetical protein